LPPNTPETRAALRGVLDARMLDRAYERGETPKAAMATSNRRAPIEVALARVKVCGGDGYIYEESTFVERLSWKFGARSALATDLSASAQKFEEVQEVPGSRRALPWSTIGMLVAVLAISGVAHTLLNWNDAVGEVEGQGSLAKLKEIIFGGPGPEEPSAETPAQQRPRAKPAVLRSAAKPSAASTTEKQVERTSLPRAPDLDTALRAMLSEGEKRLRESALVLLPVLIGVLSAWLLVFGARRYTSGASSRALRAAVPTSVVGVALAIAALAGSMRAPPRPARPRATAAAKAPSIHRPRRAPAAQRARLSSLVGASTLAALEASPATGAGPGESPLVMAPGSAPPKIERPFLGLLEALRQRKQARASGRPEPLRTHPDAGWVADAGVQTGAAHASSQATTDTLSQEPGSPMGAPPGVATQADLGSSMQRGRAAAAAMREGASSATAANSGTSPQPSDVAQPRKRSSVSRLSALSPVQRGAVAYLMGFCVALGFFGLRWLITLRRELLRRRR
jgi:hypothetical protein